MLMTYMCSWVLKTFNGLGPLGRDLGSPRQIVKIIGIFGTYCIIKIHLEFCCWTKRKKVSYVTLCGFFGDVWLKWRWRWFFKGTIHSQEQRKQQVNTIVTSQINIRMGKHSFLSFWSKLFKGNPGQFQQ